MIYKACRYKPESFISDLIAAKEEKCKTMLFIYSYPERLRLMLWRFAGYFMCPLKLLSPVSVICQQLVGKVNMRHMILSL